MSRIRARIERLERELRKRTSDEPVEIVVELVPTHEANGSLSPTVCEVVVEREGKPKPRDPSR